MSTKTEQRVLLDAVEFWKGFLEGLNWCLTNSPESAKERIIDVEVLIEEYQMRLRKKRRKKR